MYELFSSSYTTYSYIVPAMINVFFVLHSRIKCFLVEHRGTRGVLSNIEVGNVHWSVRIHNSLLVKKITPFDPYYFLKRGGKNWLDFGFNFHASFSPHVYCKPMQGITWRILCDKFPREWATNYYFERGWLQLSTRNEILAWCSSETLSIIVGHSCHPPHSWPPPMFEVWEGRPKSLCLETAKLP